MDRRTRTEGRLVHDFSASNLLAAFEEMATILHRDGDSGRIYIAGGAAMLLAHGSVRATEDVDASIDAGHGAVTLAAHEVARRHGWAKSWLNEQATAYMPPPEHRRGSVVFDHPALEVVAATKDHLLAMKVRAARITDKSDVERLLVSCGCNSVEQVEVLVMDVFGEALRTRQRLWLEGVLDSMQRPTSTDTGE